MATVIKKDLAKSLRDKLPLTAELSEEIVRIVSSDLASALAGGHRIEIRGLGVFNVNQRKPGKAYNFKTKESIDTPGMLVVKFNASSTLKRRLNVY